MIDRFETTADEVKREIHSGQPLFFVEVRHAADWDVAVMKAKGALRLSSEELERRLDDIPQGQPVVVYTTCPGDAQSIRSASQLKKAGWHDVHPLLGGFNSYREAGLPVDEINEGNVIKKTMLLSPSA